MTTAYICAPTGPLSAVLCINTWSTINGVPLFALGIVSILWLVLYFRNKNVEGARNSIATSSFFAGLVGIILGVLGFFPGATDIYVGIFVVLMLASVIPVINRS